MIPRAFILALFAVSPVFSVEKITGRDAQGSSVSSVDSPDRKGSGETGVREGLDVALGQAQDKIIGKLEARNTGVGSKAFGVAVGAGTDIAQVVDQTVNGEIKKAGGTLVLGTAKAVAAATGYGTPFALAVAAVKVTQAELEGMSEAIRNENTARLFNQFYAKDPNNFTRNFQEQLYEPASTPQEAFNNNKIRGAFEDYVKNELGQDLPSGWALPENKDKVDKQIRSGIASMGKDFGQIADSHIRRNQAVNQAVVKHPEVQAELPEDPEAKKKKEAELAAAAALAAQAAADKRKKKEEEEAALAVAAASSNQPEPDKDKPPKPEKSPGSDSENPPTLDSVFEEVAEATDKDKPRPPKRPVIGYGQYDPSVRDGIKAQDKEIIDSVLAGQPDAVDQIDKLSPTGKVKFLGQLAVAFLGMGEFELAAQAMQALVDSLGGSSTTAGPDFGGVSVGAGTASDIRQEAQVSQTTGDSSPGTKGHQGKPGCRDSLGDLFRGR